jgi:hypothetical protein
VRQGVEWGKRLCDARRGRIWIAGLLERSSRAWLLLDLGFLAQWPVTILDIGLSCHAYRAKHQSSQSIAQEWTAWRDESKLCLAKKQATFSHCIK